MKYTLFAVAFSALLFSCGNKENAGVSAYKGMDKQRQEQKDLDSIGKEAQQTFDDFKLALSMKDTTTTNFMIQQKFPIPKSELKEGIWVSDIVNNNDTLKGVVNSQVQYIKELKMGDTIIIDPTKIGDWMYYKADKMIGGFTIKYLRNKMTPEQRATYDEQFKVKFED